jgi:hypothetical protein
MANPNENKKLLRAISQSFGRIKNKGIAPKIVIFNPENPDKLEEYTNSIPSLNTLIDIFDNPEFLKIQIVDTANNSILEIFNLDFTEDESEMEDVNLSKESEEFSKRIENLERVQLSILENINRVVDRISTINAQPKTDNQTEKLFALLERKLESDPFRELEQLKKFSDILNRSQPKQDDTVNRLSELMAKAYLENMSMEKTLQGFSEILKSPVVAQLFQARNQPVSRTQFLAGEEKQVDELSNYLEQMNRSL